MCVAIVQQAGKKIGPAELYAGWETNPHGGGFAYIDKGRVKIDTGHLKYNDFAKRYAELVEKFGANSPMLIHMRIRSAGGMGPKNCHPFKIKGGAMIHNGTMFTPDSDSNDKVKDKHSDTRIFASSFFNILDLDSVKRAGDDILTAVGRGNKLCFLYDSGDYHIINEKAGKWVDGIWYSNSSCEVRPTYPSNYGGAHRFYR